MPVVTLSQQQVDRFCQLNIQIKTLVEERANLRELILDFRFTGLQMPNKGPYIPEFVDQVRHPVNWKFHCMELAKALWGDVGEQYANIAKEDADALPVTLIKPVMNPAYFAKIYRGMKVVSR